LFTVGRESSESKPIDLTQRGGEDMLRIMFVMFTLVSLMWMSAAAMAQQPSMMSDCDKWIYTINAEAGDRVDEAGYTAKQKVDDIARLCKEGQMAEAQKTAMETMTLLGIHM
jgi:hypothetical protein